MPYTARIFEDDKTLTIAFSSCNNFLYDLVLDKGVEIKMTITKDKEARLDERIRENDEVKVTTVMTSTIEEVMKIVEKTLDNGHNDFEVV